MLLEITILNIFKEVENYDKFCIVLFWEECCGPCAALRPVIEELAEEYAGKVKVGIINVDKEPWLATSYNVKSMPVVLFFRHGKPVYKQVGTTPKDHLDKDIQEYLNSPDKIQDSIAKENEWPLPHHDPSIMHPKPDGSFNS
ncbi:thioredoxin family protein [Chitinophaga sp.]|uniref:thioredoxin family protein n=1 Tax=Chitinophaga sp. TaxID=1869181 RepID=UPI002F959476